MKIAPLADVKARLSAYLDECIAEGPVVITRNGKAVAVLVAPADDEDLEQLVLARSPRFQAILNKSRKSIQEGKGLSRDEFWKAVRKRHRGRRGVREWSASRRKSQSVAPPHPSRTGTGRLPEASSLDLGPFLSKYDSPHPNTQR